MRVFIDLGDSGIGGSFLFEPIALQQFGNLTDDLLAVGISFLPFDGGVEMIHNAVDLQAGGVVYFLWFCLAGGVPQAIIKGVFGCNLELFQSDVDLCFRRRQLVDN